MNAIMTRACHMKTGCENSLFHPLRNGPGKCVKYLGPLSDPMTKNIITGWI